MIWAGFLAIFATLAGYTTWLYAKVLNERHDERLFIARVISRLRSDVAYIAERTGIDLRFEDEMPAEEPDNSGPDTDIADAYDTDARKLALLAEGRPLPATPGRHRTEAAEGNVHQIVDGIETRLLPAVSPADGERMAR